jgi:hypothetical protein
MAKDPLKIIGKPSPTPAERAQAEALAKQTGRPAKMCRAALLEARHNVAKAAKLLNDPEFIRLNTDFDLDLIASLDNPLAAAEHMMRQQAIHAGKSDKDLGPEFRAVQEGAARYERERPKREAHEKRVREATGKKLKDPVLGTLTWDTFWQGKLDVPGFGKLPMTIETDRDDDDVATPPRDEHYNAVHRFTAESEKLRAKIEKANFAYYRRVRPNYDDGVGKPPPVVKSAAAVWNELSKPEVHVPLQDGESWRIEINWGCSWDPEHGHAVYIEGGQVVHVSIHGDGFRDSLR